MELDEIKNNLHSPDKLMIIEDQSGEIKGHKYALLITAHIQNIKRRTVYKQWLKR